MALARPLRVGIAGTGFGAAIHLPALQSLPGVSVVAIAGARQKKTAEIARIHGVDMACNGITALLAEDLDAVTLALPPALAEMATALALDRGLAILAEKPLAPSAEAAEALARRAADATAIIDFEFAELHCFRALHTLIQRGELGAIERIAVDWTTRSYAHRHRLWSWKTDAAGNGGVLTLLGTHVLFLLEWLFGRIAVSGASADNAATQEFAPPGSLAAPDTVALRGRTRDGAAFAVSLRNRAAGSPRHRWEVVGARGRAVLENLTDDAVAGFRLSLASGDMPPREIAREKVMDGDNRLQPFQALAERFVAAIRAGAPCQPDFAAGARVQSLVAEIDTLTRGERAATRAVN